MASQLNICERCGKERVSDGDWESCSVIEHDFPEIAAIKNEQAIDAVSGAFREVQKLRCDFLQKLVWLHASVKKDVPRIDEEGMLVLPSWMTLRPKAMIQAENDLIALALSVPADVPLLGIEKTKMAVYREAKQYVERFEQFLLNQRKQALNI